MGIKRIAGIELDIQRTKDKQMAVIHNKRMDRTTEGIEFVKEYSFSELRKFHIYR